MKNPNIRDEDQENEAAVDLTAAVYEMWSAGADLKDIGYAVANGLPRTDDGNPRRPHRLGAAAS